MDKKDFDFEKKNLKDTIDRFNEIIDETKLKINALPRVHGNNPYLLEKLMSQYSDRFELLERTERKPFFARIDFKNDKDDYIEKCYIGKVGVMDEDNNIVTVDWRAPISSMYYDSNIGRAFYMAPEGKITGDLSIKRQYDIEDGVLKNYQDVDTVSNDDFLKPYLGVSADNRLKNIVSTIQSEQNEIIRKELYNNLVIQGVAGSGKTTVALHRIAYLVYNNIDNIDPDQYLVVGPSKFFVNYISNVLPDLNVKNVSQLTFDEIVKEIIKESFRLISDENKLIISIDNPDNLSYERFKVSLEVKNYIDKFIEDFENNIIPINDFKIKGYKVLSHNIIKKIYDDIEKDGSMSYDIISLKIEKLELLIRKYLKDNYDKILVNLNEQHLRRIKDTSNSIEIEIEKKNFDYVKNELKNYCSKGIKSYLSKSRPKILSLYIEFLNNLEEYFIEYKEKIKSNINNIKKRMVEFEDLGILMYLAYKIYGPREFDKYRHTVIDESQDFGELNFYSLLKILPNSTFSVFGDLAQSIYQYRGISDWDVVIDKVFDNNCNLKYLKKSYRTTTEIMESANNITRYLGLKIAEPVIRHGDKVKYHKYINSNIDNICDIINNYLLKKYSSIAIICKEKEEALNIYNELKDKYNNINKIVDSDTMYNGGLCVITSYLAKGLEFDGVIISDASDEKYLSEKSIDMKLLYVSMTRALHELHILYKNNICKVLENDFLFKNCL